MKQVSIAEAKAHLSELVTAVAEGSEVTITRRNKPIARLVPLASDADAAAPRQKFDFDRLRRHTASMPMSEISAADLIRKMRDEGY